MAMTIDSRPFPDLQCAASSFKERSSLSNYLIDSGADGSIQRWVA
jgi:hypothetical protein